MKHLLILLTAIVALTLPCEVAAQGIITRPTTKKEQPSKPKPNPKPAKKKTPKADPTPKVEEQPAKTIILRQTCKNLDLYTARDGECYFFSVDEWNALPASEQNKFEKKGVVIKKDGLTFSLGLHDSGSEMTWDEAMNRYKDSLPSKAQAEAMAKQTVEVQNAIRQFGGDKNPGSAYWTRDEYDFSDAWYVFMYFGVVKNYTKTRTNKVRAVAPVPGEESSFDPKPVYRQTCNNLDLYTTRDGECYFFSVDEWKALPESEQGMFEKKGVVIKKDGQLFSLALHNSGGEMAWDEAMARYGDSLPTKAQGEIMAEQYMEINNAIKQFGGDKEPDWWYWTREECSSSEAWMVFMHAGYVHNPDKTYYGWVRSVAPVP